MPTTTSLHAQRRGVQLRPCERARAEVSHWKGKVGPTVDSAQHVNGGCRSLASDGKEWECYIVHPAVRQRIIGEGLLGEYAPTPGVG
jgi:hypothetical protein